MPNECACRKALEAVMVMWDRGPSPKKLEDALSWRENDEKARAMAAATLAAPCECEALRALVATLRRRVHLEAGHNQFFERCESAWCNPSPEADPATGEVGKAWRTPEEFAAERDQLRAELEQVKRDDLIFRKLLFAAHGFGYGDDGEMQNTKETPFIDFRRNPAARIEASIVERNMRRLAKEQPPKNQATMPNDGPGTPLGRLEAISLYAEEHCGHDPTSGKPAEVTLIEKLEQERKTADLLQATSAEFFSMLREHWKAMDVDALTLYAASLTAGFAAAWGDNPPKNGIVWASTFPDAGKLEICIRRINGKSAAESLKELTSELEQVKRDLAKALDALQKFERVEEKGK